jgi:hypothetical protein
MISDMEIQGGDISEEGLAPAGYGGGIYISAGTINIDAVTISGSKAYRGGGIYNIGTLNLSNSTIFDNTAEYQGGGIYFSGTSTESTIRNSTIAENTSQGDVAGGIYLDADGGTLTVKNTIIANNYMGEGDNSDYVWNRGTLNSLGYNFVESQSDENDLFSAQNNESHLFEAETDITDINPTGLAADLTYEGGYTKVLKVTAGNILDNPGSTTETTDQRGYYRTASTPATRGAYQYNGVVAKIGDGTPWTGEADVYKTIDAAYNAAATGDIIELAGTAILESSIALDESNTITIRRDNELSTTTYVQAAQTSGTASDRVFDITEGAVTLENMTVRYGNVEGNGGGINNETNLTLSNVAITDNTSTAAGGGINNNGTLVLSNTNALSGNVAGVSINGIHLDDGSHTSMGSSTLNNADGIMAEETITFDVGESTVNYDGASQTIATVPYYNLTLSGTEDKTAISDIVVSGVFTNTKALTATTGSLQVAGISSIGANITTTGIQHYQGVATITDDVTLDTNSNDITFVSTVVGTSSDNLTVDAGTATVTFDGTIGGASAQIENLAVTGGTKISVADNITTTGIQDYNSAITLTDAVTFAASDNNITFSSTVDGGFDLTIAAGTGNVTFADHIGGENAIGTLTLTSGNFDTTGKNIAAGALTVNGAIFNSAGVAGTWRISGDVAIAVGATLNAPTDTISAGDDDTFYVGGKWDNKGDCVHEKGTVEFNGAAKQELTSGGDIFYKLTINNTNAGVGIELQDNTTVSNDLTLTKGLLDTNSKTLIAIGNIKGKTGDTAIGDFDADHMIVTNGTGSMRRVLSEPGSCLFPVGDNTGTAEYSPATLSFTSGTFAAGSYAAVDATNAKQPQNPSSTNYLNRYWKVTQDGITGFSCDTTFNYVPADVQGTEADIYGGQYRDSDWTVLGQVDTASHKFQATVTGFSDFTGVDAAAPSTQASNISFSSVDKTQMAVSWTRGNGNNVLVVAHQGNAVSSNPVDGTGYNPNAAFGSGTQIGTGNYVVYKGTGTNLTVTGLTADTTYHFRAYEFHDTVEERYNTNTETNNPNNQTTLPDAPVAPVATAATSPAENRFSANWNAATGATGYRLDVSTKSDFSSYVSGYQNKDVANVTTSAVTGLTGGTLYYYRVRAENTGGTSGNSNTIEVATLSLTTKVDLTGPSTATAGAVSSGFTLTSQDANGNTTNVTADTKFDLSSNSSGAKVFYSDAAGTSLITEVTIPNGTSTATFYYKDSATGTPILTAAWNSGGTDLVSDTFQVTVSLATTTLAVSTSVASSFKGFKVTATKIEMYNGTSWVAIFSGTAELDLVNGGTFPGISDVSLPSGTYNRIRVTFRNSFPATGTLSYNGTTYYTTAATFGGETNDASNPTTDLGSQTVFIFKISEWGALNKDVIQTFDITPVTVGPSTDYQPILRFTISKTFLLKGTAGTGSTYYFALSAPAVSIVEP